MKKTVDVNIGDKTYTLMFNSAALCQVERSIGRSLTWILGAAKEHPEEVAAHFGTIDFTVAALKAGLQDPPKNGKDGAFDPFAFIDDYCYSGGTLEDLNVKIMHAIMASTCFTAGTAETVEKILDSAEELGA